MYFETLKAILSDHPLVVDFSVNRERIGQTEGFIDIGCQIIRNFKFQIFEYYKDSNITNYRYNIMNMKGELVVRWDNAPHFPDLENCPHHKHLSDSTVSSDQPSLML
ncbi:MAG: DUF6516 family protein, partial [Candidatus Heimdallarchaeota archaeon]